MIDSLRELKFAFLALLSFSVLNPPTAKACDQIIWQIDHANPAKDPVYVVGKSDAAKDWPAYQPGSANEHAGSHTAIASSSARLDWR